jgi:hypothetical protein
VSVVEPPEPDPLDEPVWKPTPELEPVPAEPLDEPFGGLVPLEPPAPLEEDACDGEPDEEAPGEAASGVSPPSLDETRIAPPQALAPTAMTRLTNPTSGATSNPRRLATRTLMGTPDPSPYHEILRRIGCSRRKHETGMAERATDA